MLDAASRIIDRSFIRRVLAWMTGEEGPSDAAQRRHPPGKLIIVGTTGITRIAKRKARLGGGTMEVQIFRGLERSVYKSIVRSQERRAAGRWDGKSA